MPTQVAQAPSITPAPVVRDKVVKIKDEAAKVAALQIKALRAQAKELEKTIKAHEAVLKAFAEAKPGASIGTVDGVPVVKFGDGTWNGTDEGLLREAFPEAFEATRKSKAYVTVTPL